VRKRQACPFIFIIALGLGACDTIQPERTGTLVVEAYFNAGQPLPPVSVHQTADVNALLSDARIGVSDAVVQATLNGSIVEYEAVADSDGLYRPKTTVEYLLLPLDQFSLRVTSGTREVIGSGLVPPEIQMVNVKAIVPDQPIEAVLIDSLKLGLDSLGVIIDANEGFIYPVEVFIEWAKPDIPMIDNDFWIETSLDPVQQFSSSLLDFFLLSEQVLPESGILADEKGRLHWTGIYAIPVPLSDSSFPTHELKISILRSEQSFARFATTRNEPKRREPVGNVIGGIGFIGGVSLDSLRISVE